jgi:hypothetical protein
MDWDVVFSVGDAMVQILQPALAKKSVSPDVVESVVDCALFRPALMLFEVGLQLRFGLIGVRYKFPSRPECQFANVAIRSVRSAPDESDNSEPSVRHGEHHGRAWKASQISSACGPTSAASFTFRAAHGRHGSAK